MERETIPAVQKRRELTFEDRHSMLSMREQGIEIHEICKRVARHRRVVKRFFDNLPYSPYLANLSNWDLAKELTERAKLKRSKSRKRERLKNYEIRDYVQEKLILGWSPELIAGRLKRERGLKTNYQSIYDWVYIEREDLIQYLDRGEEKKNKKRKNKKRRKKDTVDKKRRYEQLPKDFQERNVVKNWEGDTVWSMKSSDAIFNLVERSSRYALMRKIKDLTGKSGSDAMIEMLSNIPIALRNIILLDNGSENSAYHRVDSAVGTETYFCEPGSPEQRGTVENRNRFIRKYLPKGTDFSKVSEYMVQKIQDLHNHRPMKCLGFRTPHEVFYESFINACDA